MPRRKNLSPDSNVTRAGGRKGANAGNNPKIPSFEKYYESESYIYYGIIGPVITVIIILLTMIIITTFVRGNFRSSTYVQMAAIAIANCLTGLGPLAMMVYLELFEERVGYPSRSLCYIMQFFQNVLPEAFHVSSLHLTVGLSIERFIVVWFPTKVKQICTMRNGVLLSLFIIVVSCCSQIDLFLSNEYSPYNLTFRKLNTTIATCIRKGKTRTILESFLRKSFIIFLPCIVLAIFTIIMIFKTLKVRKWRKANGVKSGNVNTIDRMNATVIINLINVMLSEMYFGVILLHNRIMFISDQNNRINCHRTCIIPSNSHDKFNHFDNT